MKTNAVHPWRTSLAWSAGLWIFGLIACLGLVSADGSVWRTVSLVAVLALAALAVIAWSLTRASADSRWRAALDRYAEQELAKRDVRLREFAARGRAGSLKGGVVRV